MLGCLDRKPAFRLSRHAGEVSRIRRSVFLQAAKSPPRRLRLARQAHGDVQRPCSRRRQRARIWTLLWRTPSRLKAAALGLATKEQARPPAARTAQFVAARGVAAPSTHSAASGDAGRGSALVCCACKPGVWLRYIIQCLFSISLCCKLAFELCSTLSMFQEAAAALSCRQCTRPARPARRAYGCVRQHGAWRSRP